MSPENQKFAENQKSQESQKTYEVTMGDDYKSPEVSFEQIAKLDGKLSETADDFIAILQLTELSLVNNESINSFFKSNLKTAA